MILWTSSKPKKFFGRCPLMCGKAQPFRQVFSRIIEKPRLCHSAKVRQRLKTFRSIKRKGEAFPHIRRHSRDCRVIFSKNISYSNLQIRNFVMKTLIKNGRIVTLVDDYLGDILIEDGTFLSCSRFIKFV